MSSHISPPFETPRHADLIYDIGMHRGEDTDFYLRKGFRVVAIEANPELVEGCRERFQPYIEAGRLTIIEGAVVESTLIGARSGDVRFYRNDRLSEWGTIHKTWADRNEHLGAPSSELKVPAVVFEDILQQHGIPYYLKIDIEGSDLVCIRALANFQQRPLYLSMESDKTSFSRIKAEIDTLIGLGYSSFQAVEQSMIPVTQSAALPALEGLYLDHHFPRGATGLFGQELQGPWKTRPGILRQYASIRLGYWLTGDAGILTGRRPHQLHAAACRAVRLITGAAVPGWYDTHARLG